MNVRTVILSLVIFLPLPLFARESTDVIVMKNGDRITCQVKALRGGVLSVWPPYVIETISVDWSKVARLESKQLFLVKMEDGTVHMGTLNSVEATAGGPMQIEVAETPAKKVVVDSSKMTEVGQTSEKFFQRFTGGGGLGVIYSKGNSSTQYSLTGLAGYPRERWATQLGLSSTLTASTGANVSTRNQLTAGALHLLPWNNYFYGGVGAFLHSAEQGIAGQTMLGGGVGRYFKNTSRTTFYVLGGVSWQNTHYHQAVAPIPTQNIAAALIGTYAQEIAANPPNAANPGSGILTDFVPVKNLAAFRSHYGQVVRDSGLGFTGNNGFRPGIPETGGDMGGLVLTIQSELDFIADTGGNQQINLKQ